MKRSKEFVFNSSGAAKPRRTDLCGFDFFDHDLILFCDRSSGYRFDADGLAVVGGRSAKPFKSAKLLDVLELSGGERRFLIDFLSDGSREYCLLCAGKRVVLASNRTFRTSGLGIAAVFDYTPECAASAARYGLLDRLGGGIYSPEILEMTKASSGDTDGYIGLVRSVLKLVDTISEIYNETDAVLRIKAASDFIGCSVDIIDETGAYFESDLDTESFLATLLCQLSVCRRISADRGGKLSLERGRDRLKISLEYQTLMTELSEIERGCFEFCEKLSLDLEMPLSVDLEDGRLLFEFVPYRVDPSLYGLKAGVRIEFTAEK